MALTRYGRNYIGDLRWNDLRGFFQSWMISPGFTALAFGTPVAAWHKHPNQANAAEAFNAAQRDSSLISPSGRANVVLWRQARRRGDIVTSPDGPAATGPTSPDGGGLLAGARVMQAMNALRGGKGTSQAGAGTGSFTPSEQAVIDSAGEWASGGDNHVETGSGLLDADLNWPAQRQGMTPAMWAILQRLAKEQVDAGESAVTTRYGSIKQVNAAGYTPGKNAAVVRLANQAPGTSPAVGEFIEGFQITNATGGVNVHDDMLVGGVENHDTSDNVSAHGTITQSRTRGLYVPGDAKYLGVVLEEHVGGSFGQVGIELLSASFVVQVACWSSEAEYRKYGPLLPQIHGDAGIHHKRFA